jgi:organic radical activating enzyme
MAEKNLTLVVAETFYSIQGEGKTMGIPAVFLRLGGCNLLCKSEHWVCDTIEVWQNGKSKPFEDILTLKMVSVLEKGAHLVLTGGEPMAHQQKIELYLKWFYKSYGFMPYIEVETNGTIMPTDFMTENVNLFNVSPKLESSGEKRERRYKTEVLKTINKRCFCIFKIVIANENDLQEVIKDYFHLVDKEKIYLMPAGSSQEQLNETRIMVANMCIEYCLRYSERLHIVIWNQKTGV